MSMGIWWTYADTKTDALGGQPAQCHFVLTNLQHTYLESKPGLGVSSFIQKRNKLSYTACSSLQWVYQTVCLSDSGCIRQCVCQKVGVSDSGCIRQWVYQTVGVSDSMFIRQWVYQTVCVSESRCIGQCVYQTVGVSDSRCIRE
jgi:hypothetical protein